MNFSFTSGNFHLHKFNHQNDNHQFSSNFNDNHQIRYSNQNLINSQTTSNQPSQPGKLKIFLSPGGKISFWKMAIYRFFIFYVLSLMTHKRNFSNFHKISSDKLHNSLWTELVPASESRLWRSGWSEEDSHVENGTR